MTGTKGSRTQGKTGGLQQQWGPPSPAPPAGRTWLPHTGTSVHSNPEEAESPKDLAFMVTYHPTLATKEVECL
ncbi:hypothetical protein Y1Q_0014226 [Alligator mississippiensis]|uniref:Uncharacterized protein n=1 Tax=Alligator mississippiensis TaxID=8496 RepID=A0A151MU48_ALLMI|nr:hypothetical protein Y1Q_0014226 [Alligator mississippiensis]